MLSATCNSSDLPYFAARQDTIQSLADVDMPVERVNDTAKKRKEGAQVSGTRHTRSISFGSMLRGKLGSRARGKSLGEQKEQRTESILVRRAEKIISILRILVQECFIDVGLIMGRRGKGSPEGIFGKPENEVRCQKEIV